MVSFLSLGWYRRRRGPAMTDRRHWKSRWTSGSGLSGVWKAGCVVGGAGFLRSVRCGLFRRWLGNCEQREGSGNHRSTCSTVCSGLLALGGFRRFGGRARPSSSSSSSPSSSAALPPKSAGPRLSASPSCWTRIRDEARDRGSCRYLHPALDQLLDVSGAVFIELGTMTVSRLYRNCQRLTKTV